MRDACLGTKSIKREVLTDFWFALSCLVFWLHSLVFRIFAEITGRYLLGAGDLAISSKKVHLIR